MRIRKINKIHRTNDLVTLEHSEGFFHFKESDVFAMESTNNFLSRYFGFYLWCWVLSCSLGVFFICFQDDVNNMPIEDSNWRVYDILGVLLQNFHFFLVFFIVFYLIFRVIYFSFFRDSFKKNIIRISFYSNSHITLKSSDFLLKALQSIFKDYLNENSQLTEKNHDKINLRSIHVELIYLIIGVCFFLLNLSNNSITDLPPRMPRILFKDKSESQIDSMKLALIHNSKYENIDYLKKKKKILNNKFEIEKNNYIIKRISWNQKYRNEKISPLFMFMVGFYFIIALLLSVLIILLGVTLVAVFALICLLIIFLQWLIAGFLILIITGKIMGLITKSSTIPQRTFSLSSLFSYYLDDFESEIRTLLVSVVLYFFISTVVFRILGYNDYVFNGIYKPVHSFFSPLNNTLGIFGDIEIFQLDAIPFIFIHSMGPFLITYILTSFFFKFLDRVTR
jgi:hypothetical protein